MIDTLTHSATLAQFGRSLCWFLKNILQQEFQKVKKKVLECRGEINKFKLYWFGFCQTRLSEKIPCGCPVTIGKKVSIWRKKERSGSELNVSNIKVKSQNLPRKRNNITSLCSCRDVFISRLEFIQTDNMKIQIGHRKYFDNG